MSLLECIPCEQVVLDSGHVCARGGDVLVVAVAASDVAQVHRCNWSGTPTGRESRERFHSERSSPLAQQQHGPAPTQECPDDGYGGYRWISTFRANEDTHTQLRHEELWL
jgi:hypothetical protein